MPTQNHVIIVKKIGNHHRSICPIKFTISPEKPATIETIAINQASPSANDSSQPVVTAKSTVDTVTPAVNTDHMLLKVENKCSFKQ